MVLVGILSSQLVYHQLIENFPNKPCYSISPNVIIDRRAKACNKLN